MATSLGQFLTGITLVRRPVINRTYTRPMMPALLVPMVVNYNRPYTVTMPILVLTFWS